MRLTAIQEVPKSNRKPRAHKGSRKAHSLLKQIATQLAGEPPSKAITKPLWSHALKTFGSASLAREWFSTACGALDNRAPVNVLKREGGAREIDRILGCIDYGMIA